MLATIVADGSVAGVVGWTTHMQRERRVARRGIPPSLTSSSPLNGEDSHLKVKYVEIA